MEPGYHNSCCQSTFYTGEKTEEPLESPQHQTLPWQQLEHQQQQQPQQHAAGYLQQLPYDPTLLPTTQQADCPTDQAESLALGGREDFPQAPGPATMQSVFGSASTTSASTPGAASVTATTLAPLSSASAGCLEGSSSLDQTAVRVLKEHQVNAPHRPRHLTKEARPLTDPLPCLALPSCLEYKRGADGEEENVSGVVAREELQKGAEFGPYEGTLLDEEEGSMLSTTWELCLKGKVFFYIDGRRGDEHNWMSYVACACSRAEQNMEAFQYYGQIYFRTTRVVEPGSELRVFYSEEYASSVGFKSKLQDLTYSEDSCDFQCSLCESRHQSAKHIARHLRLDHDNPDRPQEMLPVVSWRMRAKKPSEEPEEGPAESDSRAAGRGNGGGAVFPTDSGDFTCQTCGKVFPSEGRLRAHGMFHEYSDEHVCPVCGERQLNAYMLAKHMAQHDARRHRCNKCDKSYKRRPALYRHDREVHGAPHVRQYKCLHCPDLFTKKSECLKHETTHEKSSKDTDADASKRTRHYRCNRCGKYYQSRPTLYRHDREVHGAPHIRRYKCQHCATLFPKKSECLKHEKTHETSSKDTDTDASKRAQQVSNEKQRRYQIKSRIQLKPTNMDEEDSLAHHGAREHNSVRTVKKGKQKSEKMKDMFGKVIDYYTKTRPYQCRYCTKRYTQRKMAFQHEKEVHEGQGAIKCSCCPRIFMSKHRYIEHMQTHEENRLYRCALCPRTFASESALTNHQGEHTGEKPFKCELCGRGFRVRKAVYAHRRRMHQDRPKRFFCSFCQKGFPERGALVKHEIRHRGIRPFVCLTCGRGFTEKCALVAHIQCRHTKEKPFSCHLCGKSFSLNQNYTYHMFKHKAEGREDATHLSESLPPDQQQ